MFFVIVALAAIISTLIWYIKDTEGKYKLGFLSLMLWGTTAMMFIDHLIRYIIERGELLEVNLGASLLGLVLVIVALIIWEFALLRGDPKGVLRRASKR